MSSGSDDGHTSVAVNEQTSISLVVRGPIARPDVPGLCARVSELLEMSGATVVWCDICAADPDVVTVDAIARIRLVARQHDCEMRLLAASDDLRELLTFLGLQEVPLG